MSTIDARKMRYESGDRLSVSLSPIRERIQRLSSAFSQEAAVYDFAYLNGWIGALYWADVIDAQAADALLLELRKVYGQTLERLGSLGSVAGDG